MVKVSLNGNTIYHENWTIGVSSDGNFGIFKVPNMFLHIICLY